LRNNIKEKQRQTNSLWLYSQSCAQWPQFYLCFGARDIILAYLGNSKWNKQSSLSHTILMWHSKLKLEKLLNGVSDNYLLLFYSSMIQFLACVIVRIHIIKLVSIMCMIMWKRRWNCLGHAHYYMLKIRKKSP
jgi:hypothetical protein